MNYHGYLMSHGGHVRLNNEDNAYLNGYYRENDEQFYWEYETIGKNQMVAAVFDGMGGEENGEMASRLAAETMSQLSQKGIKELREEYAGTANKVIRSYIKNKTMGTTYVAVFIENDQYYFQNIGDSRGYLFRNGRLRKMTKDHNMIQEMIKYGILTKEQAQIHPDRHTLYQYLGMKEEKDVILEAYEQEAIDVQAGDLCLLCSDGLTDMITEQEIKNCLSSKSELRAKSDRMFNLALDRGGRDNITILLIEIC